MRTPWGWGRRRWAKPAAWGARNQTCATGTACEVGRRACVRVCISARAQAEAYPGETIVFASSEEEAAVGRKVAVVDPAGAATGAPYNVCVQLHRGAGGPGVQAICGEGADPCRLLRVLHVPDHVVLLAVAVISTV